MTWGLRLETCTPQLLLSSGGGKSRTGKYPVAVTKVTSKLGIEAGPKRERRTIRRRFFAGLTMRSSGSAISQLGTGVRYSLDSI